MLAAPVVSKPTTDTKDHNDHPVSDITSPKKIQSAPFTSYPTPQHSLDSNAGEYLDANSGLDSEDQQPESTLAWCKNETDSYGSYCPKDK